MEQPETDGLYEDAGKTVRNGLAALAFFGLAAGGTALTPDDAHAQQAGQEERPCYSAMEEGFGVFAGEPLSVAISTSRSPRWEESYLAITMECENGEKRTVVLENDAKSNVAIESRLDAEIRDGDEEPVYITGRDTSSGFYPESVTVEDRQYEIY